MVNRTRAITFVEQRGTLVERARLQYLLTREPPTPAIVEALFVGQRPDGGWSPFWAPGYSSLDATCFRLAQAEQLGVLGVEPIRHHALSFLLQRQHANGSWEEDDTVRDAAPRWAKPGDEAARLYLTANCGYWLSMLTGDTPASANAAAFLAGYLDSDGKLPSFAHTHWLACGLWYRIGRHELAEQIIHHLHGTLMPNLTASNLGWLIATLVEAGLPIKQPLLAEATKRLAKQQQEDGRWLSEDGPDSDCHSTLEALRALLAYPQL